MHINSVNKAAVRIFFANYLLEDGEIFFVLSCKYINNNHKT